MSAKYKSPSFLLPNELNTSANPANDTGINSLYSMDFGTAANNGIYCGPVPTMFIGDSSVSIWFKSEVANSNNVIFNRHTAGTGNFNDTYVIRTEVSGSGVKIKLELGNPLKSFYSQNVYSKSVWHHLAVTLSYSSGQYTVKFYVDGVEDSPTNSPMTMPAMSSNSALPLTIGALRSGSNFIQGCGGELDEVAIFNRALTDGTGGTVNEIAALYGGTSPNIYPSNLIATDLNPIAYYPLGEQAQNSGYPSATGNEWQFPNGVLQDYVMDFDGTDFIDAGSSVGAIGTEVRTFSVWLKTSQTSGVQTVLGTRNYNTDGWVIQISLNSILFYNVKTPSNRISSSTNLTDGNWYHLVVVRGKTTSTNKIYVNGDSQTLTSNNENGTNPQSSKNLLIGVQLGNGGVLERYFNGEMSNLAIWNSDQSTNIANIYNNGSPQTTYTVSPQNWWKLNADSVFAPSAPNYTTALDFTSPDLISINSPITIDTTQPYSISAWVYLDSTGNQVIIAGNTSGGTSNFVVPLVIKSVSGSFAAIATHQENSSGIFRQSNSIAKSELTSGWSHIVLVKDGVNCSFFYNGHPYGTASFSTTPPATVELTTIGKGFNNWYLNGRLSNLAIFDSGLTASQISTLFNFGTPETNISFSPQAWWKLNDQTAITDSSGNGNTGTNNGAANFPSGIAVTPVWKIPNALPIPTINTTSALDFTSGNKISLNPKFNFDLTSVNTISVWVNLKSYSAFNSILTNNGTGGGSTGTYTQLLILTTGSVNNTFAFYTYKQGFSNPTANSGWRSNDIPKQEFENSWHHVMLVRDGQDVSWYYDGQPWGGGTITTTQTENVDVNCIGQGNASSGGLYGEISNLAIWNSDQSSNVSNIYNSGQPQSSYTVTPNHLFKLDNLTTGINDVYSSSAGTATSGVTKVDTNVYVGNIPVNGVSTTLPSTALQQSDLQFDSPFSNYSLSFDGTGDTVAISNLQSSFTNLSISFWIKSGVDASNAYVFARGVSQFLIFQNSTNASLKYRVKTDAGTINYDAIGGNILDNNWHHCVMVVDTSNNFIKVYEDGSEVATTTTVGNIETSTSTAYLASANSGAPFKSGHFDELSMFDSVLTSAQVLEIYNNGRPKDLTTFSGTTPVSWWRLGENAYFDNNSFIVPNSISGAPNGTGSGTITTMISADAPGTYANGVGTNLDILDRVGDAPLSVANSQSYNMIPSDISPYVPQYVGKQIANNFSMTFDGVNDYFNTTGLSVAGYSAVSISAWVNFSSMNPAGRIIYENTNSAAYVRIALNITTANKLESELRLTSTGTNYTITGNTTLSTGVNDWYNVVLVYDSGSTYKIYVNGSEDGTATAPTGSFISTASANSFRIGSGISQNYFDGKIDEVAIFDTALNAGQIYNDIYQPTSTATNQTADLVNNPNLPNPVAWYRMGD